VRGESSCDLWRAQQLLCATIMWMPWGSESSQTSAPRTTWHWTHTDTMRKQELKQARLLAGVIALVQLELLSWIQECITGEKRTRSTQIYWNLVYVYLVFTKTKVAINFWYEAICRTILCNHYGFLFSHAHSSHDACGVSVHTCIDLNAKVRKGLSHIDTSFFACKNWL